MKHKLDDLLALVKAEYDKAQEWPQWNSSHEGWGVLSEEIDELWDEIKTNQKTFGRTGRIKKEAVQVAMCALRMITDCLEKEAKMEKHPWL